MNGVGWVVVVLVGVAVCVCVGGGVSDGSI